MQNFNYQRPAKKPESLIQFLLRRFPYHDQAGWELAIAQGQIKLDGQTAPPGKTLVSGMVVSYERPREDEPQVDREIGILYEDEAILVVSKNANLPISESGRYHKNTLIHILQETRGYAELYQVHRLDRETSGVVITAKSKEIANEMRVIIESGAPEKTYHAVLRGEMPLGEVLVNQPLGTTPKGPGKVLIRQVIRPDGKEAQTRFCCLQAAGGLSLVEVRLLTGRTHQIRVHAEFLGFPVLGDKLYGQEDAFFVNLLEGRALPIFPPFGRIERQLLHATRLRLPHPLTREVMTFESPYAAAFGGFAFLAPLGLSEGFGPGVAG